MWTHEVRRAVNKQDDGRRPEEVGKAFRVPQVPSGTPIGPADGLEDVTRRQFERGAARQGVSKKLPPVQR